MFVCCTVLDSNGFLNLYFIFDNYLYSIFAVLTITVFVTSDRFVFVFKEVVVGFNRSHYLFVYTLFMPAVFM